MNVKTDTKEKFTVLTPQVSTISADMTEDVQNFGEYASSAVPHIVINMEKVNEISVEAANALSRLQQKFYERNHSFVVCALAKSVEAVFEKEDLIDIMNITPTESEAWDIVQMEEIERDLLSDFDEEEP